MRRATIKISFGAGSDIEPSFKEAIRIANVLGTFVEFQFNEILCIASAEGSSKQGVENYFAESKKEDNLVKIAFTH